MALSTAEAEYIALAAAAQEAIWLRQLTTDLNNGPVGAMVILEDNQAAIMPLLKRGAFITPHQGCVRNTLGVSAGLSPPRVYTLPM